ncbi:endophilin-A3b [Boleophthalmus pectinirostris]|uniref:endophilin-A3b n=1 Tax=Boleophthalmus pectinirostris TaxID=150288 RepID=UPI000A1C4AF1|nr:endophilin-A3b [Boleophthalmus pectinirostris]
MSVSGMKKQFHKASQMLNERLMGAEGTKLDQDFLQMKRNVAVIHHMLHELLSKTTDFLQPNPAHRARLSVLKTMSRLRGQGSSEGSYPQPEGMLGDSMVHYGHELGPASEFGGALTGVGEALQQIGKAKEDLDTNVKCTFIDPLQHLHNTEIKGIKYQLKKVNGRRLDFDYRRRRRGKSSSEKLHTAWDKFQSSKELAERSMFLLLQNDVDHLNNLSALVTSLLDFHRNSQHILQDLQSNLQSRLTSASNQTERRYRPRKSRSRSQNSFRFYQQPSITSTVSSDQVIEIASRPGSPITCYADSVVPLDQPCCRALYSFKSERNEELNFDPGDIIILTNRVDENWFEGSIGSRSGLFPANYVDVLVPLPSQ